MTGGVYKLMAGGRVERKEAVQKGGEVGGSEGKGDQNGRYDLMGWPRKIFL